MNSITHALKEWAVAIQALEKANTILLLRKGGIREVGGNFQVKYKQVLLYPTYEHQKPHLLKSDYQNQVTPVTSGWHPATVKISSWANITNVFAVSDLATVKQLSPAHIWQEEFVTERFNWKPSQPLYLLLLRTYKLAQPEIIPYAQKYGGCKSWLPLNQSISLAGSQAVLDNIQYNQRVEVIQEIVESAAKN
ncbi:MAG: DUF1802 family protein [Gomphosphaeria aponina SAG 52.96 = DSM 107014]|uniref:DUF1802 family protein n=1 Tax=Gomphosphaeria aponina SAG 52.96 = DSM 107014 TaxID=1521640 RepID=A0A941GUS5_9CHRO|nr:DUF1802 family protein [Gomphosphaeria aponina SAG 52.96 = DSM 107014]